LCNKRADKFVQRLFVSVSEIKEEKKDNMGGIKLLVEILDNCGAKNSLPTTRKPV
jgi:hypothetical protein